MSIYENFGKCIKLRKQLKGLWGIHFWIVYLMWVVFCIKLKSLFYHLKFWSRDINIAHIFIDIFAPYDFFFQQNIPCHNMHHIIRKNFILYDYLHHFEQFEKNNQKLYKWSQGESFNVSLLFRKLWSQLIYLKFKFQFPPNMWIVLLTFIFNEIPSLQCIWILNSKTHLGLSDGVDLWPWNVLLLMVSGSIFTGVNLGVLV